MERGFETPDYYRKQAKRLRELAAKTANLDMAAALKSAAADLEAIALMLSAGKPPKPDS